MQQGHVVCSAPAAKGSMPRTIFPRFLAALIGQGPKGAITQFKVNSAEPTTPGVSISPRQ